VLWKYAAAPVAISTVILGIAYFLVYRYFLRFLTPLVGSAWYWQAVYYLLLAVVAVLVLVVVFFLFTRIASAVASPFNDLMSEKTEQLVRGRFVETPFSILTVLKDSGRAISHSFKILGLYCACLVAGLPLLFVPGIGSFLYAAAGVLLSAYMFAFEYLGYPMDRRRFSFSEKRRFLRSRIRSIMGFGLGNLAVASIPLVNLLLIPAAVVGGTLLFLDLSSAENAPGSPSEAEGTPG